MIHNKFHYVAPAMKALQIRMECGFTISGGFEQPEYGGEDNL